MTPTPDLETISWDRYRETLREWTSGLFVRKS